LLGLAKAVPPQHSDRWLGFVTSRRDRATSGTLASRRAGSFVLRQQGRRVMAGFGMATVALVLLVVTPGMLVRLEADYLTSTAELRTIELADGSTVALAGASAIAVSFTGGGRQVTLVEGEAFFNVKADATRPFEVVASSVRTTVVGTIFDVRRDET